MREREEEGETSVVVGKSKKNALKCRQKISTLEKKCLMLECSAKMHCNTL